MLVCSEGCGRARKAGVESRCWTTVCALSGHWLQLFLLIWWNAECSFHRSTQCIITLRNMGLDDFNAIFTTFSALCCLPFTIWVVYGFTGALSSQHFESELEHWPVSFLDF